LKTFLSQIGSTLPLTPDTSVTCFWKCIGWKDYEVPKNHNLESVCAKNDFFSHHDCIYPLYPLLDPPGSPTQVQLPSGISIALICRVPPHLHGTPLFPFLPSTGAACPDYRRSQLPNRHAPPLLGTSPRHKPKRISNVVEQFRR
jgi:hypothetical protein